MDNNKEKGKEKKKITLKEIGVGKLLLLLAAGITLLVLSLPSFGSGSNSDVSIQETDPAVILADAGVLTYEEQLEQKLRNVLSSVANVGETEVMITFKSSKETILQTDADYDNSLSDESDGAGGTRKSESNAGSNNTVLTDGSTPYVVKEVMPEIEGVVIICEGGDIATVKSEITEAVEALFGISTHKIKVLKRMDG